MNFSTTNYAEAVSSTYSQLDMIERLIEAYPVEFQQSTSNSTEVSEEWKSSKALISPIGIEGLHQIGNTVSNLRHYHRLGVKYATLTHNCHNIYADAALSETTTFDGIKATPYWHGISKDGQSLIREMNRLGMLVDLSHVSHDTMLDVLGSRPKKTKGSLAPVIFSHSSAYSICPHPRNVPDDVLSLVRKTNSLVMVNFAPDFISCQSTPDPETGIPPMYDVNTTLHQVARHIQYIGKLIGFDHVGIGSDFDGIEATPTGLEDVSKFPDLVAELLRMNITDDDVMKVTGKNILRVWTAAEDYGAKMREQGVLPLEDRLD